MSFELVLGPMFSDKTSYLCMRFFKLTYKDEGIMFKHSLDKRNYNKCVETHNKKIQISSVEVQYPEDILAELDKEKNKKVKIVAIDELHFFEKVGPKGITMYQVINTLTSCGYKIIASGLNGNFKKKSWPVVSECLPLVTKLKFSRSICELCGSKAPYSAISNEGKKLIGKDGKLMISSNTAFFPVCLSCHDKIK